VRQHAIEYAYPQEAVALYTKSRTPVGLTATFRSDTIQCHMPCYITLLSTPTCVIKKRATICQYHVASSAR
jgi:hypothetical protein